MRAKKLLFGFAVCLMILPLAIGLSGCGKKDKSPTLPNATQIQELTGISGGLPSGITGKVEAGGVIMNQNPTTGQCFLAVYWKNSNAASAGVLINWLKNNGFNTVIHDNNPFFTATNAGRTIAVNVGFMIEMDNRLSLEFSPIV